MVRASIGNRLQAFRGYSMARLAAFLEWIFLFRGGRPLAALILLWVTAASFMSEQRENERLHSAFLETSTFDDVVDWFSEPLVAGQRVLFDSYQQLSPRVRSTQPVTIVEIDERSLKEFGQWPWPRDRLAELIKAINAGQPAAIGLDMYMPEPDATSPPQFAANLPPEYASLASEIAKLPSHDAQLAAELFVAPTVLGAAGFDVETLTTSHGLLSVPLQVEGTDPLPHVRQFPFVLASLPELQEAAQGQALLSVSFDEAVRRMPLVMAVGNQLVPSLAMEMLRVATGAPAITVVADSSGVKQLQVADLSVDTQPSGDIWMYFARRGEATSRQVSAADVMRGTFDPALLKDKLILVGLTGTGLLDARNTPLGEIVPGVEIQAQVLESLLEGQIVHRPAWLKTVELLLMLGIGGLLIYAVPISHGRLADFLNTVPEVSSWLIMVVNAVLLLLGHLVFRQTGLLFDVAGLVIGLSSILVSLIGSLLIWLSREKERLAQEQQKLRESANLVAGALKKSLEPPENEAQRFELQRFGDIVRLLSLRLAERDEFASQLSPRVIDLLVKVAPLHDIGMVREACDIQGIAGELTPQQRTVIQQHTRIGAMAIDTARQVLGPQVDAQSLAEFLVVFHDTIASHHERWDGSGYPDGLAGEEIPLLARIVAVVDVYESLISDRSHRKAKTHEEALAIVRQGSGSLFDPRVVEAFVANAEDLAQLSGPVELCADRPIVHLAAVRTVRPA
jgi:CHASE2 domain-containing sensor protein